MVESAGLENRYARKGIEGSNPSLSEAKRGENKSRSAGCIATYGIRGLTGSQTHIPPSPKRKAVK